MNATYQKGLSKTQKITIIVLMLVFLLLLLTSILLKNNNTVETNNTRTVMIYLDGSNLESEGYIVTSELESLNPNDINLNTTNILIYTGGTEEWHNFIKNDENAIYLLKENGFEKIETYPQKNMGNPDTLTEFLTYSYNNYKADNFNLIFYNHGGAVDGAIYDDFTKDNLSLYDMSMALQNSPFDEKNKLQTINFRTCLNGTIEVASTLSKYAKYMIASEEITYGKNGYNVLGFLNDVVSNNDGVEFGKKFIESYKKQIEDIDFLGTQNMTITYSIIDLSNINNLNESINNFFKDININSNYADIAKIRSKLYQYGEEDKSLDMVDLYDLIENMKNINIDKYNELTKEINKTIVYNYTNLNSSHGISIYFPYNAAKFLTIYSNVVSLKEYGNFIKSFNSMKNSQQSFAFNMSSNDSTIEDNRKVKFKLTQEQIDVFSNAVFIVVKKDEEHEGYYYYLYATNDVTLDEEGYLNAEIGNKFIKAVDKNGKEAYIRVTNNIRDNNKKVYTSARLIDLDKKNSTELDSYSKSVTVYFENINDNPVISYAILNSRNGLVNGILVNLDEIEYIDIPVGPLKMIDENGKYTSNYESAPILYFYEAKMNDLELKWSSLDEEGKYYYAFTIFDINNNYYDSQLVEIER